MSTLRDERRIVIADTLEARALPVIAAADGRILNQKIGASRYFGDQRLTVIMRLDDECRNGHETFSITADFYERGILQSCGCLHEDIVARFPELAHLIKWHLCSIDGPMHYVANTLHFAGDRDCWGRRAGEPAHFTHAVRFGAVPITHKIKRDFAEFLEADRSGFDFEVIAFPHEHDRKTFGSKYTFGGFGERWHECPFNTEREALEFLDALRNHKPEFLRVPTSYSEGKARELDKARSAAIWPEATDEELTQEKDKLTETLLARLPALLAEFRRDMEAVGFLWPERERG